VSVFNHGVFFRYHREAVPPTTTLYVSREGTDITTMLAFTGSGPPPLDK
jgi:hypothetical protein